MGVHEKKNKKPTQEEELEKLWKFISEANANKSLIGCSARGPTGSEAHFPEGIACGVLQGHAYSIIDVF